MSNVKVERPRSEERNAQQYQELSNEIKYLTTAGEEIKSSLAALVAQSNSFTDEVQRDIQNLQKKSESLVSQLSFLSDKVWSLSDKVEGIESLKQQIEELRKENQELKSEVERLKSERKTLALGQMITEFERNLAKFVLSPETDVGTRGGLKFMMAHFNQKKNGEKKKSKGKDNSLPKQLDRWERIQLSSKVTWTDDHFRAFDDIKETRNLIAHPPKKIDYKCVEEQIKELYVHWGKECSGFVNMHKKLNFLLALGHIAYEFQGAIVPFILPERRQMSLAEMIKWLKDNTSSEEGKAANTRWSNLVQGKEWTSKHEEALLQLMELDRKGAILHLDIDFEEAKTHIAEYMADYKADDDDKEEIKQELSDIIDMMKTIPQAIWDIVEEAAIKRQQRKK